MSPSITAITLTIIQLHQPSSTEGGGYHPLEDFFQATKTLFSATEWLQLIVGSSFVVILAEKK